MKLGDRKYVLQSADDRSY